MIKTLTFRKQVIIPLTRACMNSCTYCTYVDGDISVLDPKAIHTLILKAKKKGCYNIVFKSGENVDQDLRVELALRKYEYSSFLSYLIAACRMVIGEGMLPAVNVGALRRNDLKKLKPYICYVEYPLETVSARMGKKSMPHNECPGKKPDARMKMLHLLGQMRVPLATGILVSMGETRKERYQSLEQILYIHRKYGNVQEIFIRPAQLPRKVNGSSYSSSDASAMVDTARYARAILGDIPVQVPLLKGASYFGELLQVGVSDLGVMSMAGNSSSGDSNWPSIRTLKANLAEMDFDLTEEQAVRTPFLDANWYSEQLAPVIKLRCKVSGN